MNTRYGQNADQLPPQTMPGVKEIPYDYVATFTLEGRRGNRIEDVINISIDGSFIVVAIGYSFIPPRLPQPSAQVFKAITGDVLSDANISGATSEDTPITDQTPLLTALQCFLIKMCGIDFKYSIVDSATGRELQNKFIHNIAGFGEANGNRPFRPMAKPILFQPRSTIRIVIEEISEGDQFTGAELYIVLHGYKMLGHGAGLS